MSKEQRERESARQPGTFKLTPTGAEDVEFSLEEADADDLEALARAEAADRRAKRGGRAE